jgi:5-hydroxyisourate hydrolase-like protein (transthyretin family)
VILGVPLLNEVEHLFNMDNNYFYMKIYYKNLGYYIFLFLFFTRCASTVPPSGGKRDKTPPELLTSKPATKSLNFKGQEIELFFNEYIKADNLNQQLIITPPIDGTFEAKPSPKSVKIILKKPLQPDLTYSLNFRDAIKDASEGNPARNLKLVFSTGSKIDSLSVSGQVKMIETGQPTLDVSVGLYRLNDTITKQKPLYFTKTDSAGKFSIENVKEGIYRAYAILDKSNDLKYQPEKEFVGFIENPIDLRKNLTSVTIDLFREIKSPQRIKRTRPTRNTYEVEYALGTRAVKIDFAKKADSMAYTIDNRLLKFYRLGEVTDTIPVKITVIDSLDRPFEHTAKVKFNLPKPNQKLTKEPFTLINTPTKVLSPGAFVWTLKSNKPISKFDLSKIRWREDTLRKVEITEKDLVWNTYRTEVSIRKNIKLERVLEIKMDKGALMSIEQDSSAVIEALIPLENLENLGVIAGKVQHPEGDFIVQLLSKDDDKVIRELRNQAIYRFENLDPKTYRLRLIKDINKNGRWDSGDIEQRRLPEPIIYYPEAIPLKANFEIEGNDF